MMEGRRIKHFSEINFCIGLILCWCCFSPKDILVDIISISVMIFFMVYLVISHVEIYLKYLHCVFAATAAIAGCSVIEFSEIFLIEINTDSSFKGAIPLLVLSYWTLLTTLVVTDNRIKSLQYSSRSGYFALSRASRHIMIDRKQGIAYLLAFVGLILIVFVFMKVFNNPSFALGIDRFQYAKLFDYGKLYGRALWLISYLLIPCIVIALYNKSPLGWGALALYCCYSFWTGNKFGSFFSLACFVTMIYYGKIKERLEKSGAIVVGIAVSIGALVILAVFAVSFTYNGNLLEYLLSRTAQQGQLWWRTYSLSDTWHLEDFHNEISGAIHGSTGIEENVDAKYGIYNIMYFVAPQSIIDAKLANGSRYAEAGFASAYYYMGAVGCILFAIIGGVITSFLVNSIIMFVQLNQYLRVFICVRLYLAAMQMLFNFIFGGFFGITSLISYIILFMGQGVLVEYNWRLNSSVATERG